LQIFEELSPEDLRPRKAVEAAEKYARGEIAAEVMTVASRAAEDAAHSVAHEIARLGAAEAFRYKYSTHPLAQNLQSTYIAGHVARRAACAAACVAILADDATPSTTYAYTAIYNTVDAISWVNLGATVQSVWDSLIPEFQRLCRLENEYREVVRESAIDEETTDSWAEAGSQAIREWSFA
jgi:hypothetical protein